MIPDLVCEPDLGPQMHVLLRQCSSWYPHGVVRREGNPQKRKPSPCKHVCFTSCLHILALHVFNGSPLELAPFRLPLRWHLSPHCFYLVKLLCDTDKFLSLLKGVSIDPPCELALFCLPPLCWLSAVFSWSCFLAKYYSISRYQIWTIMRFILAMPKRYPRDTLFFCSRHPGARQSVAHSGFQVAN